MEPIHDMNQALALLDMTKHWRIQCENSAKQGRRHSCTIWDKGRRVTASARTPLMAVTAAFVKLRDPVKSSGLKLKVIR